jgi:hypothetical protein
MLRTAPLVLLAACADDPARSFGPEVPFAGTYRLDLEDTDESQHGLDWFQGEVVVSGAAARPVLDFGEARFEAVPEGEGWYWFAGDDPQPVEAYLLVTVDDAGRYDDPDYTLSGSVDFARAASAPREFSFVATAP